MSSRPKAYRTDLVVQHPEMYAEHVSLDPTFWNLEPPQMSGEEFQEHLSQKLAQDNRSLSMNEALQMIYHPDENVLEHFIRTRLIDAELPPWWEQLDTEIEGINTREALKTAFSKLTMGFFEQGNPYDSSSRWEKERQKTHRRLISSLRGRLWRRVLDGAASEGHLWTPLLDIAPTQNPRHYVSERSPESRVIKRIRNRAREFAQWAGQEATEEETTEILTNFSFPPLKKALIQELPVWTDEHIDLALEKFSIKYFSKLWENNNITEESLARMVHRNRLFNQYGGLLSEHPQAGPQVWEALLEQAHQHDWSLPAFRRQGRIKFHRCEAWMRHAPSRSRYLREAPPEVLKGVVQECVPLWSEVLPFLIENRPELVAPHILDEAPHPPDPVFADDEYSPRALKEFLQKHSSVDLSPLLGISDSELRQKLMLEIGRWERTADGPQQNKSEEQGLLR